MMSSRPIATLTLLALLVGPVGGAVCALAVCAPAADAPVADGRAAGHCGGGHAAENPTATATATATVADDDCCTPSAFDSLAIAAKKASTAAAAISPAQSLDRPGVETESRLEAAEARRAPPDLLSLHATLLL
jgi:hypothetical protein